MCILDYMYTDCNTDYETPKNPAYACLEIDQHQWMFNVKKNISGLNLLNFANRAKIAPVETRKWVEN